MREMEQEQPRFDAPTPGMALTHEVGARPWQTPPKLVTVDEVAHTIDTGMMVIPVLMEMMMLVGDKAGVKYNTGMEEDVKAETRDANIASVLEELEQSLDENEEEMMEEETVEAEEEPMGLMSRRAS